MKNLHTKILLLALTHFFLYSCSQNPSENVDQTVFESRIDSIPSQYQVIEKIQENTYLEFDGGTLICVKKDAFLDAEGNPVNSNIKLELKEVQSLDEFLDGRVSTMSNGRLLATSGSYYINASTSAGDALTLNKNVGLNVAFPTISKDQRVELFTGQVTDSGDVNWIPAKREETKMPLQVPDPPRELAAMDDKFDVQQAGAFVQEIERNYVKSGDLYVHDTAPDNNMQWSAKYVEDVKKWYAYNEKRLLAYAKLERKYEQARRNYFTKMKAWINQNGLGNINSYKEVKSYEYYIDQLGWYNCDKFVDEQLVAFSGTIEGESRQVRVHLLSYKEMIHLTSVSDDKGGFTFEFPKGTPFEIFATGSNTSVRKQFDGNNTNLEKLKMAKKR